MKKRAAPTLQQGHASRLLEVDTTEKVFPWTQDFDLMTVILSQPVVGLCLIQNGTFCWCNEVYAKAFGYTLDEMIGSPVSKVVSPRAFKEIGEYLKMRERGDAFSVHYLHEGLHRDGDTVYFESYGTRVTHQGKPATAGILVNVTEHVLRERELKHAKERLKALTKHNNEVLEKRRARIARELHDVLGGILTSLKMDISRLIRRHRSPAISEITGPMLALTQQAIDEVHNISLDLHPTVLDHLGLKAAISDALAKFGERYSITTELKASGSTAPIQKAHLVSLFRVFQETLTNIAQHAAATHVEVTLVESKEGLRLSVSDNGCGITQAQCEAPRSFGIFGMRERTDQLNGELHIDGRPGHGTTVTLQVPIPDPAAQR